IAQVAEIEKRSAAGIGGKSCERVARVLSLVCLVEYGGATKHRGAVGRCGCDVASRRSGVDPASIDGIDGNVGAIRGVRGSLQFSAIFFAGLRDAPGEFNKRFSAWNRGEDIREALDGD